MIMELAIGSIVLALVYFFYIIFSYVKVKGIVNNQEEKDLARMLDKDDHE